LAGSIGVENRFAEFLVDVSVKQSVGKADQIRRESISSNVGRLPQCLVRVLLESAVESVAEFGAAFVTSPVRTDQEKRIIDDLSALGVSAGRRRYVD
jgi:hypothetical protein